jgi:F-type H+-transporting ATPase subunit b
MLIDWFTVVAQAINFLILVWLLQRFLYKPVLAAIDMRETKIAAQLADATATKKDAQKERDDFRAQNDALQQQRGELLRKASADADVERQRLLDAARRDSETLTLKLNDAVTNQRDKLNREIVMRTQEAVFGLARRALGDLASMRLEDCMIEVFIRRLEAMPAEEKKRLAALAYPSGSEAVVRSAFEISAASRARLQAAVQAAFNCESKLNFATLPNLVCGIELTANGQRLIWSIADYLDELSRQVTTSLEPIPVAAPVAAPVTQHAA